MRGEGEVRGVASAHIKVTRANGTVEYRRSVGVPSPWWSIRLWFVWLAKHREYNAMEKDNG